MAQSLTQLYVHLVFSTKNRTPFIFPEIQTELYQYIGGILNNIEFPPIQIGGVTDHVHILTCMSKKITLIKLVEEIKRSSSVWLKTKSSQLKEFYWQDGYGAFTVGSTQIQDVVRYIQNQQQHHTKRTFQDEYRLFLNKYKIPYDEKYVWD